MTNAKILSHSSFLGILATFGLSMLANAADTTGWREIKLAGDTACADGSPYSIFVNEGSSGNLVFDFMGGGACWNAETCGPDSTYFRRNVPKVIDEYIANADGIYNRQHNQNPFRKDTHVIIPYCTGDVHWGMSDETYAITGAQNVTILHRGAINAKAAIDETFQNLSHAPSKVFVTGCSAGAYGSIWWTPYIRKLYPGAEMTQFGDSGASVLTADFRKNWLSRWHIERSAPAWIPGLNPSEQDLTELDSAAVYTAIGRAHPEVRIGQFNYFNDIVQRWFFAAMGGQQTVWAPQMRAAMMKISNQASNFNYYIAPWDGHCILPFPEFYSETPPIDGLLPFPGWFSGLLGASERVNEPCRDCAQDP